MAGDKECKNEGFLKRVAEHSSGRYPAPEEVNTQGPHRDPGADSDMEIETYHPSLGSLKIKYGGSEPKIMKELAMIVAAWEQGVTFEVDFEDAEDVVEDE